MYCVLIVFLFRILITIVARFLIQRKQENRPILNGGIYLQFDAARQFHGGNLEAGKFGCKQTDAIFLKITITIQEEHFHVQGLLQNIKKKLATAMSNIHSFIGLENKNKNKWVDKILL